MLGDLCWAQVFEFCSDVWWRDGGPWVTSMYQLTSPEISCVWWKHSTEFVSSETYWQSHRQVLFIHPQPFFPMASCTGSFQVKSCVQQDKKGRDSWGVTGSCWGNPWLSRGFSHMLCLTEPWAPVSHASRPAERKKCQWSLKIMRQQNTSLFFFFFFDRVTCAIDTDTGSLWRHFGHLEASLMVSSYTKWRLSQAGWFGIKY